MEHHRPDGTLAQGYYCPRCGAAGLSMVGNSEHGLGRCEYDLVLIGELAKVNRRDAQACTRDWNVGDWVVYDMRVGQVNDIRGSVVRFSDGFCETSGNISDRFRPLTLKNKAIVETFNIYYKRLKEIDGESGFNYPDISNYFSTLALEAIDAHSDGAARAPHDRAQDFICKARDYEPVIHDVRLFRSRR